MTRRLVAFLGIVLAAVARLLAEEATAIADRRSTVRSAWISGRAAARGGCR